MVWIFYLGAVLLQHVDALPTHIVSAILQVDQKVDEDWPLVLVDHEGINKSKTWEKILIWIFWVYYYILLKNERMILTHSVIQQQQL